MEGNRLPFRKEIYRSWRATVSYLEHTHCSRIPQSTGTLTFDNARFSVSTPHGHCGPVMHKDTPLTPKKLLQGPLMLVPSWPLGTHEILGRTLNAVQFVRIHSGLIYTNSFQFEGKGSIWKHNEKKNTTENQQQRMRWLDAITDSMDISLSKLRR